MAIHGPNGAGKTNILEAISMLSPGRGMRGAAPGDQARQGPGLGWQIRAEIGPHAVATRALPGLDHRRASCYLCAARAWRRFLPRHIL